MKSKITVLGGDARTLTAAEELRRAGYTVTLCGFGTESDAFLRESLSQADAVILPMPVTRDCKTVNAPLAGSPIGMDFLLQTVREGTLLLGGQYPCGFLSEAEKNGLIPVDYALCEALQIRGAVATAEAALAIVINETPITVGGMAVAMLGFGRIARLLARSLHALGAAVTVFARKEEALAWAEADGHRAVAFSSLAGELARFDVLINTVPELVLPASLLPSVRRDALILDLASAPGGVDFEEARTLGLHAIHALGLPGKNAPLTAGKDLAKTILAVLEEKNETRRIP